jgi:heme-degrading monooxygenase HmoA
MKVVVFRSRLDAAALDEYQATAERMSALARTMPGYRSHKTFIAEDGERLTLVEFESDATLHGWAVHPDHAAAKQRGRASFYTEYRIQVCEVERDHSFARK